MAVVGRIAALFRYPVKSMLGESIDSSIVTDRGVEGDRAYALVDAESGKLVSAKRPRLWGRMLELRATYSDADLSRAHIHLSGGDMVATDDPDVDRMLSEALGRKVRLVRSGDDIGMLEEVWIPEKNAEPYGPVIGTEGEDRLIEIPASMGAPAGTFFDYASLHVVTTATLNALATANPDGRFDPRRFRPNLVIETEEDGFVENGWLGQTLTIGDLSVEASVPTPRCVMTTLPQEDLPKDPGILRTAARANPLDFGPFTNQPCVGLYADVKGAGNIAVGDEVRLA